MHRMLVSLMVIATLAELGMSMKDVQNCNGRECISNISKASQKVLRIDWKPISVWPEVARGFRSEQ